MVAATVYAYSQGVFVPQFRDTAIYCNKISMGSKTYELEPFKNSDIDSIGLRLEDYQTVN